ncbi:MAG: hypothetical protein FJX72_16825, partial [Armatimonadetes bacterium]|nr:hypothetical protein [Armatimonadota bacterium]
MRALDASSPAASGQPQDSSRTRPALRSAPAVRNPRDDRPRGAGIGRGSRMGALGYALLDEGAPPLHGLSTTPSAGGTYQWEGAVAMTNTGNGNKLTKIPLFGWTARGGMPVELALYHNSQGTHNSELGYKWTFTYDIYLIVNAQAGTATVHWGDDLAYTFGQDESYNWVAPSGIHDTLTAN